MEPDQPFFLSTQCRGKFVPLIANPTQKRGRPQNTLGISGETGGKTNMELAILYQPPPCLLLDCSRHGYVPALMFTPPLLVWTVSCSPPSLMLPTIWSPSALEV